VRAFKQRRTAHNGRRGNRTCRLNVDLHGKGGGTVPPRCEGGKARDEKNSEKKGLRGAKQSGTRKKDGEVKT